jgi:hypothetical protein
LLHYGITLILVTNAIYFSFHCVIIKYENCTKIIIQLLVLNNEIVIKLSRTVIFVKNSVEEDIYEICNCYRIIRSR